MLSIIRRVFSFSSWSRSHPNEPHPGDMLDAQFDAIIEGIDDWDSRVKQAIRPDGKIAAGAVVESSLDSALFGDLTAEIRQKVADDVLDAKTAARRAEKAKNDAEDASAKAYNAREEARVSAELVRDARGAAMARIDRLSQDNLAISAELHQLAVEIRGIDQDFQNATPVAEDWAKASWMWAEWMDPSGAGGDSTLPDEAVKIMDITGDHWSARWWANYAARAVQMRLLVQGEVSRYLYYATAGQTIYAGMDYYGQQLTVDWTSNAVQVFVNGLLKVPVRDYNAASQPPNQLILVTAPALGSPVEIIVTKPFEDSAAGTVNVKRLRTSGWTFTPGAVNFPLIDDASGQPINIPGGQDHTVMVSVNGIWQSAIRDYTTALDQITFTTAPEVDSLAFGIVFNTA